MTNQEYIIDALNDKYDDGGATWEYVVNYHISCPYYDGDRRAHCGKGKKVICRETCVECKAEWLESEVDE